MSKCQIPRDILLILTRCGRHCIKDADSKELVLLSQSIAEAEAEIMRADSESLPSAPKKKAN